MKPTAYLINASRGNCIDEEELYIALKSRKIAGAALDVHSVEPKQEAAKEPNFQSRFRELDNVVLTPHLGASTQEAQKKTSLEIAEVVINYLLKGDFSNAVNVGETIESEKRKVYPLFIHHRDIQGAFRDINKVLADNKINIRENPSRQLGTDGNVITVYLIHQIPSPEVLEQIRKLDVVHYARQQIL